MLNEIVRNALAEDAPWGDITSEALVPAKALLAASFVAREPGIMSGGNVIAEVFHAVDRSCKLDMRTNDADRFVTGAVLAEVTGSARSILRAERVALNFLQRMCGIATVTAEYVAAIRNSRARIVDTRKTLPGLRLLDKQAVRDGGGHNHRYSLSDAVLVKDNHLGALGGIESITDLRELFPHTTHIEIEVDRVDQIERAVAAGAHTVLCDNFSIADLQLAVKTIDGRALVSASGGVTLETVGDIANTGVDLISVGAITHSVRSLDIGLDVR